MNVSSLALRFQGWRTARQEERIRRAQREYNDLVEWKRKQEERERRIAEFNAKSPDEQATIALGKADISVSAQEIIGKRCAFTYPEAFIGPKTFITKVVGINASYYGLELELAALPRGKETRLKNDWFLGWYFKYYSPGSLLVPGESVKVDVADVAILN
ncbi:MAG TPA: hypothetical protein VG753_00145 [Candidatus Paceibacterota bacterium]|nr:hypothetical protein [Candidatus Paceibacterota bacterium]